MKKNFFFATTSLTNYWNENNSIVFSGDWCFENPFDQKKRNIIKYQWDTTDKVINAQSYCQNIYKQIIKDLTKILNSYFDQNKEIKHYEILIGIWLIHFIHQYYDKYTVISEAKKMGNFYTYSMHIDDYKIPTNWADFSSLSEKDDYYQLQLYSNIIDELGLENIPKKKTEVFTKIFHSTYSFYSINKFKIKFKIFIYSFVKLLFKLPIRKNKIIFIGSYFKQRKIFNELLIFFKSKFKITFDDFNYIISNNETKIDYKFRNSFKKNHDRSFSGVLLSLILQNIPSCYLENYNKNISSTKKIYNSKNNSFATYNNLWINTSLQFFLSNNYQYNKIFAAQHGTGYGIEYNHIGETFERSISDKFLTFGWSDNKNTIPFIMPMNHKKEHVYINYKTILFISNIRPRYIFRFINCTSSSMILIDHIKNPIIFFNKTKNLNHIKIRYHKLTEMRRKLQKDLITKKFPNMKIDKLPRFQKSILNSRIFVSDHLGTTFLESMQRGIPSILILNLDTFKCRKSFEPYLDKLIQSKIVFFHPEEAATHLDKIYDNPALWWEDNLVKRSRSSFIKNYCNTDKNWINIFCKTLIDQMPKL